MGATTAIFPFKLTGSLVLSISNSPEAKAGLYYAARVCVGVAFIIINSLAISGTISPLNLGVCNISLLASLRILQLSCIKKPILVPLNLPWVPKEEIQKDRCSQIAYVITLFAITSLFFLNGLGIASQLSAAHLGTISLAVYLPTILLENGRIAYDHLRNFLGLQ